jgi:hypothetical protein
MRECGCTIFGLDIFRLLCGVQAFFIGNAIAVSEGISIIEIS